MGEHHECCFYKNLASERVNSGPSLFKGVARGGGPGVPVTPLCKPFFKQTTYNIPWRKRHDDNVWHSVTPLWKILVTPPSFHWHSRKEFSEPTELSFYFSFIMTLLYSNKVFYCILFHHYSTIYTFILLYSLGHPTYSLYSLLCHFSSPTLFISIVYHYITPHYPPDFI